MEEMAKENSNLDKGVELTILMPCLNEAETLEICIKTAKTFLADNKINGEVLIADNGSTDGSIEIAKRNGARVCNVKEKGYGSALIDGTKNAYGKYVIMGDSDDSYDFLHLMPFVEKLREGYDLVMGNRFKGGIEKDAMPWSHKYIGTPVLSFLGRLFYKSNIGDFNCGLRGYNRESILKLGLRTTGMEYASEMIVQATLNKLKIAEVPTTLKKDGRSRPPHLKSFRDGCRHLQFLLIYSPRWLFLYPGLVMFLLGLIGMIALAFGDLRISDSFGFGIHTMLYCGGLIVIGFQAIEFSLFAKVYATNSGMHPKEDKIINKLHKFTLEKGLILGMILALIGLILTIFAIVKWGQAGFSTLDPLQIMPITIPAVDLLVIGVQSAFASFFLGILNIKYKKENAS